MKEDHLQGIRRHKASLNRTQHYLKTAIATCHEIDDIKVKNFYRPKMSLESKNESHEGKGNICKLCNQQGTHIQNM